ncbi:MULTISPECIES: helix-turn-helix transcriptional regulator [Mycolicibacterium]|uniref:Helix-turn-helix domain-containing protein n=1 Tax=Mycolicibacterium lutetiense TaxID=1641992 RepID=A0ABS4ZTM1_9MYCO|nr:MULTISPECIES: helix-turn-helix domain-containing protein [Mycolicibacterium]MBP2452521.1 hypothetical protein [Mycolicibacterium lutetiense]OBB23764.1 hypothetical protein A5763_19730 [Mycolicibacterium fortuitum]OBB43113.1 hypothetical protein A5754_13055 [Mycolicibacterium fortuitum]OBB64706.1 hypothetical protein A5755_21085 [Mycolicibacterium fortuitum]OBF81956.1 hypothetical protein A5751_15645 [Mycolicibacterium fortuitum]
MNSQTPAPPRTRLSTSETAEFLGLPASTLRYWRHTGVGPTSYHVGHRVFYDLTDLECWLAAEKAKTARGGVEVTE